MMISFKNKKKIYLICSITAILSLGLTACTKSQDKVATNSNETSVQQKNTNENSTSNNNSSKETMSDVKTINLKNAYVPKLSKKQLEKGSEPKFSTPWKSSVNGTFSACIEGKGAEAIEEGTGEIYIRDNGGNIFSFEISDNKKISPLFITWVEDKKLLVVIGSSQGTVSKGGNLYLLDINTGKISPVLQTPDKKQQIMNAEKAGNNINLKVNVYEDDNYNKSHIENWIINSFDINLNKPMEVKNSDGKLLYIINGDNQ